MQRHTPESVADAAAVAALLQIGAEIGADQVLDSGEIFSASDMAKTAGVPVAGVTAYLAALLAAGLIVETEVPDEFQTAADYTDLRHQAGYVSWAMHANGPFIDNARAFLTDPAQAARTHRRNGRRVAVSSRWIGERAFYPQIIEQVVASGALRVTDLGAGAGALLIKLLQENPARTGTAVDSNGAACAAAREAARACEVHDRLTVAERPIESLVDDPGPVAGAEAILACYVMHDIVADERTAQNVLGALRDALAPGGFLAVADAVSYAQQPQERKFSALFTYLHATFMSVLLPTEQEWLDTFDKAGFSRTRTVPIGLPGGRLFVASR
ncbi:class I SAM-dependent methyltransferase [Streptomyces sp. DG2A-72]|uniref:class I SAM-dependent methyltransferase n=1 Tax=Streptomyces sp. DG2A-72 TaxID=3051386 RepID=UPI00265C2A88|nr:class I SAM-dependent methyltransferase [Streptomyces sp. DG2A-72]MDO0931183.1 class I SAM-dependent methyltransferase [Streptomyces sp. DG2A-72]